MKKRTKKIVFISIAVVLTLVLAGVAGSYFYAQSLLNKIERETIDQSPDALGIDSDAAKKIEGNKKSKNITNIALFGIDAEEGKAGRSDSIMILSIDEEHGKVKLASIMRDSYVNIDGRGMDKINHAYAFGGPQLALKTINSNYKLNLKDFVAVNFSSLPKLVDAVGGVDIDIKDYELSELKKHGITSTGMQRLNGEQALRYSRIRYVGNGDYERTERHRTILNSVFTKLMKQDKTKILSTVSEILPMVKTNLSNNQIMDLTMDVIDIKPSKIEQTRFPADGFCQGKMINGIYYLTFDQEATNEQLYKFIFE